MGTEPYPLLPAWAPGSQPLCLWPLALAVMVAKCLPGFCRAPHPLCSLLWPGLDAGVLYVAGPPRGERLPVFPRLWAGELGSSRRGLRLQPGPGVLTLGERTELSDAGVGLGLPSLEETGGLLRAHVGSESVSHGDAVHAGGDAVPGEPGLSRRREVTHPQRGCWFCACALERPPVLLRRERSALL